MIGAGASGLMAAYSAAVNGNEVLVIEKNEKAGKKIYITGKGRCNITNDISPEDFLPNVVSNRKFLTGAIYRFSPERLMRFLEEGGLHLKTERGGRVFPLSDKASDVTACLLRYCQNAGVDFHFNERAEKIEFNNSTVSGIITDKSRYSADAVIVCTGGVSYPATGSTGDGFVFARRFGLSVKPLRPALCGIVCEMSEISRLQGLTLKNVRITASRQGKILGSFFGEMLFTHFGISGPIVLSLSSLLNGVEHWKEISLEIDLKPALDEATLDKRLLRDFEKYKNKQIQNALDELLPKSLVLPVLRQASVPPEQPVNALSKAARAQLLRTLKGFRLQGKSLRPIEEGIVTAGGVDVAQIHPKTMECKSVPGLYFCGEALDVDAFTGGFNLQIAFMTGYAAGNSIR